MDNQLFEEIFRQVRRMAEQKFAGTPGCHDFEHTLRVMHNAELLLAQLPSADARIVRLAALLHDIARADEIKARGGQDHAARGAREVPGLLAAWPELPSELVAAVAEAVRTHRYRSGETPQSLEAEIVYDADKLDSTGAVGIARAFHFAGRERAKLHNTADVALHSEAYSVEDTAYREYLVKLRFLPEAMRTSPGREMARERVAYMTEFFRRMNAGE